MNPEAIIFDIKRDCSEDGPGVRTTVFFKGCPLSCSWCQNPEGKSPCKSLAFHAALCQPQKCGAPCVEVCPSQCFKANGSLKVDHGACTGCGACFTHCPSQALEPVGWTMTLDQLMVRVMCDKPFYQSTGGGVTLSGGEPTLQLEFTHHFLKALKAESIHTTLETCGLYPRKRFHQKILPFLDLIYFDLKFIDETQSLRHTGRSNVRILENFEELVRQAPIPVIPRIPLIPGLTATQPNLRGIANYLRALQLDQCALMPYNPLWLDKLKRLGHSPL